MKKLFTLFVLLLTASLAMAQDGLGRKVTALTSRPEPVTLSQPSALKQFVRTHAKRQQQAQRLRAQVAKPKAGTLVEVPADAEVQAYTPSGAFYVAGDSDWEEVSLPLTMNVAFAGNKVYIQGLAYYFEDAWVEGTISGTDVVFPSGQYLGTDEYGDEYLVGIDGEDESNDSPIDIVFHYDAETGVLTLDEGIGILEVEEPTDLAGFTLWAALTLTPGAAETTELPDGVTAEEWIFKGQSLEQDEDDNYYYAPTWRSVQVALTDDEVYIQGLCYYLPDAWVKGVRNGNTITVPTGQYFGIFEYFWTEYPLYFVGTDESDVPTDVVFELDEAGRTLTTDNGIGISGSGSELQLYEYYYEVSIKKPLEAAATPATPSIDVFDKDDYGHYAFCTVPFEDVEGNALSASRLSYRYYYDIDGQVAPFTLSADLYEELDEDMSVLPVDFTDSWDIYGGSTPTTYLYAADINRWTRLGIQTIYDYNGTVRESEIAWIDIEAGEDPVVEGDVVVFDFNALTTDEQPVSTSSSNDGDITEDTILEEGPITLTVTPSGAKTANRYWLYATDQVIQLRLYGGSLTFESDDDAPIVRIEFDNGKWNEGNTASVGTLEAGSPAVWTGESTVVTVDIAGNTQLNRIEVTVSQPNGINDVRTLSASQQLYNLQGQRVSTAAQKGVYVQGGKKVLR